ncbi:MAG: c-type cytochrome biogenesis protein CcmI [Gammaproteobacteria bacterium]|nr:c-type cytochrome biogenesis protein CcmI [Gammaproteobacteria bacterium]
MTLFIIVAALLLGAALLFIVPPLIKREPADAAVERRALNITVYRDQLVEMERDLQNDVLTPDQYRQGREELERRLLEDVAEAPGAAAPPPPRAARASAIVLIALVPLLAVGGYVLLGAPGVLLSPQSAPMAAAGGQGDMAHQINQMVTRLEQRLASEPDNAEGWAMLGRSYLVLERFDDARTALEKAVTLGLKNPELLVDYADALAMASGQSLEGRPLKLIEEALALDPNNHKGLWLAGTAAYERADYRAALEYWRRLYAMVPRDSDAARAMEGNIAEVESLLGESGGGAPSTPPAPAAAVAIKGTVSLDPALRGRVQDPDTVFVFAQAPSGPRMPLAALRAQVKDLPLQYALDDSMAMDPSLSLSHFPEVVVVARVSRGGSPMPQSGDLQGRSAVVRSSGAAPVDVRIGEVLP